MTGGLRNRLNFWDFYDTPFMPGNVRDRVVNMADHMRVISRFGATGSTAINPLSAPPPAPAYHTAFDRGPTSGPNAWNLTMPNGSISSTDIFAVVGQMGHDCR
jgi:hypothetical protein